MLLKSMLRGSLVAAVAATALTSGAVAQPAASGGFLERWFQAYLDELNPPANPPAADPNTPATRRAAPFPPQPVSQPPFPFIDWPYGGASTIGASVPNAVVSPLMQALAPTPLGQAMQDAGIQLYGWVNAGMNLSTNTTNRKNGNAPVAYMNNPNTAQLDQFALYLERVPNTVQQDHMDWGFRFTGLYGTNYRYTTALGLWSKQLLQANNPTGYDIPMAYGEVYIPQVAQGLLIRFGRYISVPDIEAQLAPNNYMYSHSMTYTFDNYTNTGVIGSLQLNPNWMVQAGISAGTDTMPWNGSRDPGRQPSFTACLRWSSDDSADNAYACANGLNNGQWGYNNLQQFVFTYYKKFSERWHLGWENLYMFQRGVPNVRLTGGDYSNTPFSYIRRNPPNQAFCGATEASCRAEMFSSVAYLNYRINDNNNLSFRGEVYDDMNGQRTGVKTRYVNAAIGLQHWISPSILVRPEIGTYNSLDRRVFDGGTRRNAFIAAADIVFRF